MLSDDLPKEAAAHAHAQRLLDVDPWTSWMPVRIRLRQLCGSDCLAVPAPIYACAVALDCRTLGRSLLARWNSKDRHNSPVSFDDDTLILKVLT